MLPIAQELKDTFKPPYQLKDLFSVFISLFVMIAIPLTVIQVANQRDTRTSASVDNTLSSSTTMRVKIDAPTNNQTVSGVVEVSISANDTAAGISSISLMSDGKELASINNPNSTPDFNTKFSWDTTKEKNGAHNLVANATNTNKKTLRSSILRTNIINEDTESPGVSFSNLDDGAYLSSNYEINIVASDNLGIQTVKLEIDKSLVKIFSQLPYTYSWDLSSLSTGIHLLKATAIDFSGNASSSQIQVYKGIKGLKN